MIIVFAGTVTAGKSTHLKLLGQYLKSKGMKLRTLNIAAFGGPSRIIQLLSKKWLMRLEHSDSWVAFKVKLMLLADMIWTSAFVLPFLLIMDKVLGRILIIEDYFITSTVDYLHVTTNWYHAKHHSNKLSFSRNIITRASILLCIKMLRMFPFYALVLLDAEDDELQTRQKARGAFEHFDYVIFRRMALSKLLSIVDGRFVFNINTSRRPITDVHLEIIKALNL
jgi:hypothetical protein